MSENYVNMTPETMLDILFDPEKLACLFYSIAKLDDIDDLIDEHGMEAVVQLAFEAVAETYGGEA